MVDLMLKHSKIFEAVEIFLKCMCTLFSHIDFAYTTVKFPFWHSTPPTALTVEARYEAMCGIFGHSGYFVKTIPELRQSLTEALKIKDRPSMLNVIIGPSSDRKEQSFNWLTESKL